MDYEGQVIRPPSEAGSIILQVSRGCSHNRCTFCGAYQGVRFRFKEEETVARDLAFAAQYCRRQRRVFLADGDALIMPQARLAALLARIRRELPWVNRVSLYGNAKSILAKTGAELRELKELGLARIYLGLESGDEQTLLAIRKGVTAGAMVTAAQRARAAGLFLSATVLLGIGGRARSQEHAFHTGRVLTAMAPNQIAALTLILLPGTVLAAEQAQGRFEMPQPRELLLELKTMIEELELQRGQFQANHASNYLPLNARLPRDKALLLATIAQALEGRLPLTPEGLRRL